MPAAPPAQPPAPTPVQEKAPAQPSQVSNDNALSDIYTEIDSLDEPKVEPPKGAKAAKPEKQGLLIDQTGALKGKVKEEEEEPEEQEEVQPDRKTQPEPEEQLPKRTRDLKTVYLDLKKRHQEMESRLAEREKRLKEIEERNPEEASAVMQRLEAAEKRAKELDDEIKYVNYTKSNDFVEKYQKPYQRAWEKAVSEIGELTVEQEDGSTRQATAHDLLQIANMPLGQARQTAKTLFGDAADDVMAHRRTIRELSEAQSKALEEAQKNAGEREKTRNIEAQAAQANRAKAWQSTNQFLEEKFPKAFKIDESDPDDKSAHTRGFALADLLYAGPQNMTPEQVEALPDTFKEAVRTQRPLNESEMIKLHALARLKMANEPRLASRLRKAQTRIAELEKSLKAYESSEPPGGKSGRVSGKGAGSWQDELNAEIDALDTQ